MDGLLIQPSFDLGNIAYGPEQAAFPELWEGLVFYVDPSLGPTGLTLFDHSGYGNNGALINMVAADAWVVGERGYALDYDSSNDVVQFASDVAAITGSITVSCWFRTTGSGAGAFSMLVGRRNFGSTDTYQLAINNATNAVIFQIDTGTTTGVNSNPIALNEWHLATGTWIQGSTLKLYIDGQEVDSDTKTGSMSASGGALDIGGPRLGGFTYEGQIGPVSIYNRALLPNEIQLMAAGATPAMLAEDVILKAPDVGLLLKQSNMDGGMMNLTGGFV